MRWAWPGIFSLDVPEGWRVVETGGLIEITPPKPVGSAQISVLKRKRNGPVTDGEASDLVSNFARKQGGDPNGLKKGASGAQHSARAEFETRDDQGELHWDVEAHVWEERALVCSFCHDGLNDEIRRAAAEMFRSIEPLRVGPSASIH